LKTLRTIGTLLTGIPLLTLRALLTGQTLIAL
jgi:hypothetical protein